MAKTGTHKTKMWKFLATTLVVVSFHWCSMCVWMKAQGGDCRLAGALSRCSSLSSVNTSSGVDMESPSDTASLFAHHLIRRWYDILHIVIRSETLWWWVGWPAHTARHRLGVARHGDGGQLQQLVSHPETLLTQEVMQLAVAPCDRSYKATVSRRCPGTAVP